MTRRFSLEKDFMNYSTDDLLYGAMQYLATYHPEEEKLYLSIKSYNSHRRDFYNLCDLNAQSLKRHLTKLISEGLIQEEEMKCGKDVIPVYTFPYDYDGNYQMVDNEMLWYIVSTRSKQAIRVYVYLLNCFKWKQREQTYFIFTNKDILKALGYSPDNKLASSVISNILESFCREGVFQIEEFYEEHIDNCGNVIPTPKKRLLMVADKKQSII